METTISRLEQNQIRLEQNQERFAEKLGKLEQNQERMEEKLGRLELRQEKLEHNQERLEVAVSTLRVRMDEGLTSLHREISGIHKEIAISTRWIFSALVGLATVLGIFFSIFAQLNRTVL